MKPIKNSSTVERLSKGCGISFHKHYKTSQFSQLKMQGKAENFMRNYRKLFQSFCSSKHLTMQDYILNNGGLCPKIVNLWFSHRNCLWCAYNLHYLQKSITNSQRRFKETFIICVSSHIFHVVYISLRTDELKKDSNKKKMLANKVYHGDRWEEHCSNFLNSLYGFIVYPFLMA